jgi:hypothetical protein
MLSWSSLAKAGVALNAVSATTASPIVKTRCREVLDVIVLGVMVLGVMLLGVMLSSECRCGSGGVGRGFLPATDSAGRHAITKRSRSHLKEHTSGARRGKAAFGDRPFTVGENRRYGRMAAEERPPR